MLNWSMVIYFKFIVVLYLYNISYLFSHYYLGQRPVGHSAALSLGKGDRFSDISSYQQFNI